MYFPIGWPKVLASAHAAGTLVQVICNRDKILFAILSIERLEIWFCKPCVKITSYTRSPQSLDEIGFNRRVEWRPDSSMLVIVTTKGYLIFYNLSIIGDPGSLYHLEDSHISSLKRENDELFVKETIPSLHIKQDKIVCVDGSVECMACIRDELMVSTCKGHVLRYHWNSSINRDYCLDLRRTPFSIDLHVSNAVPLTSKDTFIIDMEYSPLVGGFGIILNDGRAALLTASSLKFDPNQVQGIWAPNIDTATCTSLNHKYRLIAYGLKNSQGIVFGLDERTGGLQLSHKLMIPSQVWPGGGLGSVRCTRWTPDGCALVMAWENGGFAVWSTFGALLVCSLAWNFSVNIDLSSRNPLNIISMEWSIEGYQLWMINGASKDTHDDTVLQMSFLKSALAVNPTMSHRPHLYLQGEDKLYLNVTSGLTKVYKMTQSNNKTKDQLTITSALVENKQWIIVYAPSPYLGTNWPIRTSCIDDDGKHIVIAGRCGLAHYSLITHRWKLFGNEIQEKDMIVTGGVLWWRCYIICGCYSVPVDEHQVRIYNGDSRLSNDHMISYQLTGQALLLDCLGSRLAVFCSDGIVNLFNIEISPNHNMAILDRVQTIDMSALCIHPTCVVSVLLTTLRIEPKIKGSTVRDNFLLNINGNLLLVNQQSCDDQSQVIPSPILLASCVENAWVSSQYRRDKPHLTEALWLFCGAHGMRVWLPLFPKNGDKSHTFMSKRIMLPFQLKIYPLAILFEDAILLGAENDTLLYTSDTTSVFSLPFCQVERTSQVYLHQILRQLIRRNLGFHAWEVARCCTNLPYFSHSLELLLHEVLEEEATSKEPIPDAQLPSVIEFIQEFPNLYLETVVQCARKTEIALWPYLFSAAGKPKDLFQECLKRQNLNTAASYLIILQNLESSSVSCKYATLLLDSALDSCQWDLSKDLVRFLKAIDPNDADSPRTSCIFPAKYSMIGQASTVNPNEEDLSFLMGNIQVRGRSISTSTTPKIDMSSTFVRTDSRTEQNSSQRKRSVLSNGKSENGKDTATCNSILEEFFTDTILQKHAAKLLSNYKLRALGYFAARLDFHLVEWLAKERNGAARIDNYIVALRSLYTDFSISRPLTPIQKRSPPPSGMLFNIDKPKWVDGGSAVGDSGYMSCQDVPQVSSQYPQDGFLTGIDEASTISESEDALLWNEERTQANIDNWNIIPNAHMLEQLSSEHLSQDTSKAEVQLRYLLQLLFEAGCLEWSFIVSVFLRDALAVQRLISIARSPEHSYDSVSRLKQAFILLYQWSCNECFGYRPFMSTCQAQLGVLNRIITSKQPAPTVTPQASSSSLTSVLTQSSRSRSASEGTGGSHTTSEMTDHSIQTDCHPVIALDSSCDEIQDNTTNFDTASVVSLQSPTSCLLS
ncbi:PREDICTED: guanine nucleotide exchange factor subunit Rich [Diuraphis noxia]|uniref:guanine nucleotide exchange factor subunit Rich n=1 Tax=Diuraphis noxia TaxID=143948 RepID=UPI0007635751|nr:PREDICTED: guanine nucleotide exchange factor subunit Rich [Diuraphis noxia]